MRLLVYDIEGNFFFNIVQGAKLNLDWRKRYSFLKSHRETTRSSKRFFLEQYVALGPRVKTIILNIFLESALLMRSDTPGIHFLFLAT